MSLLDPPANVDIPRILACENTRSLYHRVAIPKGYGNKKRHLLIPSDELRWAQKWLLHNVLYPLLKNTIDSSVCFGFMPNSSIADAIRPHLQQKYLYKMDIRNFFTSCDLSNISFRERLGWQLTQDPVFCMKLWALFFSAKSTYNINDIEDSLIRLVGVPNNRNQLVLPMGAPTSPFMANVYFSSFDRELKELARLKGMNYSRYADDLIFSGSQKDFSLIKNVRACLSPVFRLHVSKTRVIRNNRRQQALGLVANEKLSIPRTLRRELRSCLHRYGSNHMHLPAKVKGMLAWIYSISPEQYNILYAHYQKHYNKAACVTPSVQLINNPARTQAHTLTFPSISWT